MSHVEVTPTVLSTINKSFYRKVITECTCDYKIIIYNENSVLLSFKNLVTWSEQVKKSLLILHTKEQQSCSSVSNDCYLPKLRISYCQPNSRTWATLLASSKIRESHLLNSEDRLQTKRPVELIQVPLDLIWRNLVIASNTFASSSTHMNSLYHQLVIHQY